MLLVKATAASRPTMITVRALAAHEDALLFLRSRLFGPLAESTRGKRTAAKAPLARRRDHAYERSSPAADINVLKDRLCIEKREHTRSYGVAGRVKRSCADSQCPTPWGTNHAYPLKSAEKGSLPTLLDRGPSGPSPRPGPSILVAPGRPPPRRQDAPMDDARLPARTLLESARLPYADLARFAAREGRRPRPIYQAHKWFARRLGSAFRALLVGSVSDPTADFWAAYYENASLEGLDVLDPFVGGGTSVFEAQRLGANAIGVDVDPVACAVTILEARAASLPDLKPALLSLQENVGASMKRFHTTIGTDGASVTILHHFWVQVVECRGCGLQIDAHPNHVIAEDVGKLWAICAECGEVHGLKAGQDVFRCRKCGRRTDVRSGPVTLGSITCPSCEYAEPLIEVGRRTRTPPRWRPFAFEAFVEPTGRHPVPLSARVFQAVTKRETKLFCDAEKAFQRRLATAPKWTPATRISRDRSDDRLVAYGYRTWRDLFNARQLLHLSLLAEEIAKLKGPTRDAMAMAFSNHLATNCMMTAYAAGWRRLTPIFSVRAFRHIPRPVEINPWTAGTGRGSFPNAVRQITRAAEFARAPKEPKRRGGFQEVRSRAPTIPPKVICGSARKIAGLKGGTIDLVLTDPPYFDNVAYSELADFYAPWLKMLKMIPSARARRTSTAESLLARRGDDESAAQFSRRLGDAFVEIHRVLRTNGLLVFTFRHSTGEAWLAMAEALARAPLRPVQVLPLPGEVGVGLHSHAGTTTWDAVLVFRKRGDRSAWALKLDEASRRDAIEHAEAWWRRLRRLSVPFTRPDLENLRRASLVAAALGLFGAPSGAALDLADVLEES